MEDAPIDPELVDGFIVVGFIVVGITVLCIMVALAVVGITVVVRFFFLILEFLMISLIRSINSRFGVLVGRENTRTNCSSRNSLLSLLLNAVLTSLSLRSFLISSMKILNSQ